MLKKNDTRRNEKTNKKKYKDIKETNYRWAKKRVARRTLNNIGGATGDGVQKAGDALRLAGGKLATTAAGKEKGRIRRLSFQNTKTRIP